VDFDQFAGTEKGMKATKRLGIACLLLALHWPGVAAPAEPATPLAPAPVGFDVRREGIERGRVETIEYDSKSVGVKRKMLVYIESFGLRVFALSRFPAKKVCLLTIPTAQ
jgi:hypothetical protein